MTIVVPTLWTPKAQITLPQSITSLSQQEGVSQIVLINNSETPLPIELTSLPKVECANPPTNLFVNASWNLGASMATSEHLMILNDDIIMNADAIPQIKHVLNVEDCLIGCGGIIPIDHLPVFDKDITIQKVGGLSYAFGCSMSLRTASYHSIPDCVKIWYGDNYLEQKFLRSNKLMFKITSRTFKGFVETSSHSFPAILHADHDGWKQIAWN